MKKPVKIANFKTTKRGIYFLNFDSLKFSLNAVIIKEVLKNLFRKPQLILGLLEDLKEAIAWQQ